MTADTRWLSWSELIKFVLAEKLQFSLQDKKKHVESKIKNINQKNLIIDNIQIFGLKWKLVEMIKLGDFLNFRPKFLILHRKLSCNLLTLCCLSPENF